MGLYCTTTDLVTALPEDELIRLTDDEGSGAMNALVALEAIKLAGAEIDAHLGQRTKLPLAGTIPKLLVEIAVVLAVVRLYSRTLAEIPESWSDRAKSMRRLLEKYAAGEVGLGIQPPPDAPDDYQGGIRTSARPRDFGPGTMDRY